MKPALVIVVIAAAGFCALRSHGSRNDRTEAAPAASVPPSIAHVLSLRGRDAADAASSVAASETRPAAVLVTRATTAEEVRSVLRFTREATANDRRILRRAALESDDPLVSGNALKALGRLKLLSSDEALLALTSDPRPRVRQDAVTACGLDGGAPALARLEHALATGDATIRPLVLRSLGRISSAASRRLIESAAADSQATEVDRAFARAALARLGR